MKKSKISVIIPVYNEENTIKNCLESLDKQKSVTFEVILVDDGSIDRTLAIVSKFQPENYKLKILRQNHLGPATARNLGAKRAGGEVLVFVDADMTFEPNFLLELTRPIFDKKVIGTHSTNEKVSNWGNIWARFWQFNQGLFNESRISSRGDQKAVYRAIKKSEFNKVHGFDVGGYTDDLSLVKKIGKDPKSVRSTVFYHSNPDNLREVFAQAKWSAKREYKLGRLGALVSVFRYSPPISLIVALLKLLKIHNPLFIVFKLVYDAGFALGIIEYKLLGKSGAK